MNALLTLGIIVYSIICVLLLLLIIIQGGKAEGLFSSAQANVLGSQRGNALTKATTILSTIFIVGALLISMAISTQKTAFDQTTTAPVNNVPTTQQQAPATNNNLIDTNNLANTNN
ncbi:preprotein translocase subunit SecG [Brachyspira pilosicoli]|uniref:preprotein translocase subunit SecG n=1 Tax=Brachyspira pilosicoli TaxID=52584 RepID=UPI00300733FE